MFSASLFDSRDLEPFKRRVNVFSVDVARKPELENGDKIMLPPSFLEELSRREISYPMMFKLENPENKKSIYCGVIEFSAEPGTAYIPRWMMKHMALNDAADMVIYNVTLQKGAFVLIRPHTYKFNLLDDPKSILEGALINYATLTRGTTIQISYGGTVYRFDIQDLKPARAVCIIETDLRVDFAEPRDIKEYEQYLQEQKKERDIKNRFQMTSNTPILASNSNGLNPSDIAGLSLGSPSSPQPTANTNIFAAPMETGGASQPLSSFKTGGRTFKDPSPPASQQVPPSAPSTQLPTRDPAEIRNARAAGLLSRLGRRGEVAKPPEVTNHNNTMGDEQSVRKVEKFGKIIIEEQSSEVTAPGTTREVIDNWVYFRDRDGRLIRREPLHPS